MRRTVTAFRNAEIAVEFDCGHRASIQCPARGEFSGIGLEFVIIDTSKADCFECDLIADPRYVRVTIGYHIVCHCLKAMQGDVREHTAYAYALKDCPNCGGDGVQG